MRFHVYNGLSPQCNMSGFSLQYGDSNIPLNFPTDGPLIPEDQMPFVPQGDFNVITPKNPVDCGNYKVNFSNLSFSGPPDHVVSS